MSTKQETTVQVLCAFLVIRCGLKSGTANGRLVVTCGHNTVRNNVLALLRPFISLYVYYREIIARTKESFKPTCLRQCIFWGP